MNDKEIIGLAIEKTNLLSKKHKAVLKLLCESGFAMPAVEIEDIMKVDRGAVDLTLRALVDRGYVTRTRERVLLYAPNKQKILELLERYKLSNSKQ